MFSNLPCGINETDGNVEQFLHLQSEGHRRAANSRGSKSPLLKTKVLPSTRLVQVAEAQIIPTHGLDKRTINSLFFQRRHRHHTATRNSSSISTLGLGFTYERSLCHPMTRAGEAMSTTGGRWYRSCAGGCGLCVSYLPAGSQAAPIIHNGYFYQSRASGMSWPTPVRRKAPTAALALGNKILFANIVNLATFDQIWICFWVILGPIFPPSSIP